MGVDKKEKQIGSRKKSVHLSVWSIERLLMKLANTLFYILESLISILYPLFSVLFLSISLYCPIILLLISYSRVAVVYAGPTFHDEVASVVACILHDLGFYVVVYIGNGVHFGGMMVPFSGRS